MLQLSWRHLRFFLILIRVWNCEGGLREDRLKKMMTAIRWSKPLTQSTQNSYKVSQTWQCQWILATLSPGMVWMSSHWIKRLSFNLHFFKYSCPKIEITELTDAILPHKGMLSRFLIIPLMWATSSERLTDCLLESNYFLQECCPLAFEHKHIFYNTKQAKNVLMPWCRTSGSN